ncbi:hypothetical protein RchiOBHm_Chr5g0047481 [Rosa chinensis]|uniref:Uncharacterized protein n=1 Tax=Rosa chinensis TaxID=74649 RepID=A0A2P6QEE3_ROSCH|nr:hypothetical protein RchiOBHm_Chr5g0047481 [Rosa chinensis]
MFFALYVDFSYKEEVWNPKKGISAEKSCPKMFAFREGNDGLPTCKVHSFYQIVMAELEKLGQKYRVALRYFPMFSTNSFHDQKGSKLEVCMQICTAIPH